MILLNETSENINYTLFSEVINSEYGRYTAYGISARDTSSDTAVVHDVTADRNEGLKLFRLIVKNAVMPVHIRDVAIDFIS